MARQEPVTFAHDCVECGAPLSQRAHKERIKVGRYTVEDASVAVPVCANGHAETSLDVLVLYDLRASVWVLRGREVVAGGELKDIRRSIGLTHAQLAPFLGVSKDELVAMERSDRSMDRAHRYAPGCTILMRISLSLTSGSDATSGRRSLIRQRIASEGGQ
jgi:DNA-binding XRE family transcriptional regulator